LGRTSLAENRRPSTSGMSPAAVERNRMCSGSPFEATQKGIRKRAQHLGKPAHGLHLALQGPCERVIPLRVRSPRQGPAAHLARASRCRCRGAADEGADPPRRATSRNPWSPSCSANTRFAIGSESTRTPSQSKMTRPTESGPGLRRGDDSITCRTSGSSPPPPARPSSPAQAPWRP
jgi:hypothetical protein